MKFEYNWNTIFGIAAIDLAVTLLYSMSLLTLLTEMWTELLYDFCNKIN